MVLAVLINSWNCLVGRNQQYMVSVRRFATTLYILADRSCLIICQLQTLSHIRLGELLRQYSSNANLIVV